MNPFQFIIKHQAEIFDQTLEHLGLTGVACAIAVCIGVPLGIFLTRHERISTPILGATGVIQTIPSVALLGFLLPLLGIGVVPAIVALFLYALLPIIRNTYTGINEVDLAVREAARGMGMSDRQILTKVELPLAVPVLFAGIRTATVINVGVATLTALIAAGGLGEFIFRGIALNNVNMILAGAFPAAGLALLLDFILSIVQKHIRKIIKPLLITAGIALIAGLTVFFTLRAEQQDSFRAGFTAEFMQRPDGYPGFREHYGLSLNTVELDPGLMYKALLQGKVDVICGFSTDGRIKAYDLKVLQDDRNYFPPYYAAPLVNGESLRRYPELESALSRLEGRITNQQMAAMNYKVDENKKSPDKVAREFMQKEGFELAERDGKADVIIGSKNFTEQYILAHVFRLMIESYTPLNAGVKTGMAGTKICFDALENGDIDLYPEYTGTGLLVLLNTEKSVQDSLIGSPDDLYQYVKSRSREQFDLHWLAPLGFNNTYAMMMRNEQANRLGVETISDLKTYLETR
ncbi:MAG: glycine betaine ABC transporter substrate-binding protein [candidate division KSB1 bacterium]|nr:glycine betaine ABC transporter substrate-binding protein [candidate division KSB1 bacterium]